jgi:3'-phosphoadenosine 5'-phosphosulfate sulfotransferase (PAPS reductase)/FAD synthetase
MQSLKEITAMLLAPKALPAPGVQTFVVPSPTLEPPVRKKLSLKLLEPGAAGGEGETRRERAVRLRAEYPSLSYDFAPSPSDEAVDPFSYDIIIVAFSGGKDSLALLLLLLEMGVPKDRIELWHHDVDGREGSTLMDWPCTHDYCQKVADALGIKLYFSWKVGGYEREMTRNLAPTAEYRYEVPGGRVEQSREPDERANRAARSEYVSVYGEGDPKQSGEEAILAAKRAKLGYRMVFPQKAADLKVRWCSAYVKIMVCDSALANQGRFKGRRTLVLTGERAEESAGRAKYAIFEPDRADLRTGRTPRHIDHWRPVLHWPETEVWKIIDRYRVNAHPAYHLGWGRVSCAPCIFGSPDQWASLRVVNPEQFNEVAAYETKFGKTIDRKYDINEMAERGSPFAGMTARWIKAATSREYTEPVFVDPWDLPSGAILGDGSGPT